jgi:hypothetical protein
MIVPLTQTKSLPSHPSRITLCSRSPNPVYPSTVYRKALGVSEPDVTSFVICDMKPSPEIMLRAPRVRFLYFAFQGPCCRRITSGQAFNQVGV